MNLICQSCGEEITGKRYACPFNNIDNVCHTECVIDWFDVNIEDIINSVTTYYEED